MPEQSTGVDVAFDCVIRGLDKKLAGPTTNLIERVLEVGGFEGQWSIRHSKRIRKKGRGRFAVIRLENRGGAKSIRMWCKPQGNDTGFEYSLYPPAGVDIEMAFRTLQRVHPVALSIPESDRLPGAFVDRLVGVPPMARVRDAVECVEVEEEAEDSEEATHGSDAEQGFVEGRDEAVENQQGPRAQVDEGPNGTGSDTLKIEPKWNLWDEEVADRALLAIAFVAEDGYAKKSDASASIIGHLGVKGFCGGASDTYTTVESSMRALTMAMCKKWRYIERVRCSSRSGKGVSESVKGYKVTAKGERRISLIKGRFGEEVLRMVEARAVAAAADPSQSEVAASVAPSASMTMSDYKSMVAAHDDAERQIREIDEVIGGIDADIGSIRIDLEGLESVGRERMKRIKELESELRHIQSKRGELEERITQKERERAEYMAMREPHEREIVRVERAIGLGGGK